MVARSLDLLVFQILLNGLFFSSPMNCRVAVRVTEMFYGVAADAEITKNRVHRFCEHMTFSQRSQKLLHGPSVVNGPGCFES